VWTKYGRGKIKGGRSGAPGGSAKKPKEGAGEISALLSTENANIKAIEREKLSEGSGGDFLPPSV